MARNPKHMDNLSPGWVKGQSGNPKGRPVEKPFLKAMKEQLAANDGQALKDVVAKLIEVAKEGDIRHAKELLDRVDGKVADALDVTTGGEAINQQSLSDLSPGLRNQISAERGGPVEEEERDEADGPM